MDWSKLADTALSLGSSFLSSKIGRNRAEGIRVDDKAYDQFSKYQDWQYNTAERLAVQDYYSPENQLRLAQEAGLNPNTIFGSGFSPGSVSAQSSPGSSFGGSSSGLASSILMQDAQTLNAFASARKTMADADISETQAKFDKKTYDARVKQVQGNAEKVFKELGMLDLDADIKQKTYDWFAKKSDVELQQMSEHLNIMRNEAIASGMQLDTIRLEQGKLVYDIAQSQANIENTQASTANIEANTANTIQDTANKVVQNGILQSEAGLKQIELGFSSITGVPIGTPEFNVQYTLWAQGKWTQLASLNAETTKTPWDKVGTFVGSALNNLKGILGFTNPQMMPFFTK